MLVKSPLPEESASIVLGHDFSYALAHGACYKTIAIIHVSAKLLLSSYCVSGYSGVAVCNVIKFTLALPAN